MNATIILSSKYMTPVKPANYKLRALVSYLKGLIVGYVRSKIISSSSAVKSLSEFTDH